MSVGQVIKLLLDRMNTRQQFVGAVFGGFAGGTAGNMELLQKDANAAIHRWLTEHDVSGLQQLTTTLHAYSILTDTEFEQIMTALADKQ